MNSLECIIERKKPSSNIHNIISCKDIV